MILTVLWKNNIENFMSKYERMKLDPYHIPDAKFNTKFIKSLNERPESIRLIEENVRGKLWDIKFGNAFLWMIPKAQATNKNS